MVGFCQSVDKMLNALIRIKNEAGWDAEERGDATNAIQLLAYVDGPMLCKIAKCLGGVVKDTSTGYFAVEKQFGHGVSVRFFTDRENVCVRVKVGAKLIPAQPEQVIPAQVVPAQPEKWEDVYAWKCPESILRPREAHQEKQGAD